MPQIKNKIGILVVDKIDKHFFKILNPSKYFVKFKIGITNNDILQLEKKYNVLIIRSTRVIDKSFLNECNFEIIAACSRGTDNIDVSYANKKKIKIINSEFGNYVSTAEHTFALILSIYKSICYSDRLVRSGNFLDTDFSRYELKGKKIGIIGIGRVGSYVAKLAKAFGMIVYANDIDKKVREKNPGLNFKSINFILSRSDIITIHIPLNRFNENFISQKKLKLLNKNSVLINTSRGKVVDEKSLINLLKANKIFYAGLDVYVNEPFINKKLFSLDNVILTNHIAGKSLESNYKIVNEILIQLQKYYEK